MDYNAYKYSPATKRFCFCSPILSAFGKNEQTPDFTVDPSNIARRADVERNSKRISTSTGGKSWFAKTWQDQIQAFGSIREDLGNTP
jgi:hypothetical protein